MHTSDATAWRVLRSAPSRIVIALLWLFGIVIAASRVPIANPVLKAIFVAALVVAGYALYVRALEWRPLVEFSFPPAAKELAQGLAIGTVLFTVTIAVIWACGDYTVTAVRSPTSLIAPLGMALVSAVPEEILFRGVVFRIAEERLGSVWALILSSLLFGAVHLSNPHATIVSAVAIALEAGLLLGAAYMSTRRLWLPIGMHAAWNFTQAGVFGVAVSGQTINGLLVSRLSGPDWLSGGEFGAEASLPAVIVCLVAACVLYRRASARQLVQPNARWVRKQPHPTS